MANHPSALKRNRQSQRRRARNNAQKSDIKNLIKQILAAPKSEAEKLVRTAQSKIDKAARKNVLHWKTAVRKVASLARSLTTKS